MWNYVHVHLFPVACALRFDWAQSSLRAFQRAILVCRAGCVEREWGQLTIICLHAHSLTRAWLWHNLLLVTALRFHIPFLLPFSYCFLAVLVLFIAVLGGTQTIRKLFHDVYCSSALHTHVMQWKNLIYCTYYGSNGQLSGVTGHICANCYGCFQHLFVQM